MFQNTIISHPKDARPKNYYYDAKKEPYLRVESTVTQIHPALYVLFESILGKDTNQQRNILKKLKQFGFDLNQILENLNTHTRLPEKTIEKLIDLNNRLTTAEEEPTKTKETLSKLKASKREFQRYLNLKHPDDFNRLTKIQLSRVQSILRHFIDSCYALEEVFQFVTTHLKFPIHRRIFFRSKADLNLLLRFVKLNYKTDQLKKLIPRKTNGLDDEAFTICNQIHRTIEMQHLKLNKDSIAIELTAMGINPYHKNKRFTQKPTILYDTSYQTTMKGRYDKIATDCTRIIPRSLRAKKTPIHVQECLRFDLFKAKQSLMDMIVCEIDNLKYKHLFKSGYRLNELIRSLDDVSKYFYVRFKQGKSVTAPYLFRQVTDMGGYIPIKMFKRFCNEKTIAYLMNHRPDFIRYARLNNELKDMSYVEKDHQTFIIDLYEVLKRPHLMQYEQYDPFLFHLKNETSVDDHPKNYHLAFKSFVKSPNFDLHHLAERLNARFSKIENASTHTALRNILNAGVPFPERRQINRIAQTPYNIGKTLHIIMLYLLKQQNPTINRQLFDKHTLSRLVPIIPQMPFNNSIINSIKQVSKQSFQLIETESSQ